MFLLKYNGKYVSFKIRQDRYGRMGHDGYTMSDSTLFAVMYPSIEAAKKAASKYRQANAIEIVPLN